MQLQTTQSNLQGKSKFGINQVAEYFKQSLITPHNYVRIAKQYLRFTIEFNFSIDTMSVEMFLEGKAPIYKTACNKFLKFAISKGIDRVYDDSTPDYKGNRYVLAFLANAQIRENSKETYARALQEFYSFAESKSLPPNRPTVLAFLNNCKEKGLSPYTRNTYLSAIKQFIQFCISKNEMLNIASEFVEQMRDVTYIKNAKTGGSTQKQYAKDSLTLEERELLLSSITNRKDKAIIALMAYQGLRTIEVVRLTWEDVKDNTIAILGKGREEKELIPLLPVCKNILNAYKRTTDQKGSMFGFKDTSSIRKIASECFSQAGLNRENLSAHSLRHTTAQLMTEKEIPKPMIQRFLRHKSEAMTSTYTAKQEDKAFLNYQF